MRPFGFPTGPEPTGPQGPQGALGSNPPISPPTLAASNPLPIQYGGTGASNSLPPGALRFFGTNASNVVAFYPILPQRVLLASLAGPSATWSANQWVGPNYSGDSGADVVGFFGLGFARVQRAGRLRNFAVEVAYPTGSSFDAHLYTGPSPDALSFSGVIITVVSGQYVSTNLLDELEVAAGDCAAVLNSDPAIGFTPSAMSITADFNAYP